MNGLKKIKPSINKLMAKYKRINAKILKTTGTTFSLVKKLLNREKMNVQIYVFSVL